jgi:hypothetical protein
MILARIFYALMGDQPDAHATDPGARAGPPAQLTRKEPMTTASAASPQNILAQIWSGVEHTAETVIQDIESDGEKVLAVLEGAAKAAATVLITDVKRQASSALNQLAANAVTYEPGIAAGVEAIANTAVNSVAAPLPSAVRLPLINFTDAQVDKVVAAGSASFQAWALKLKAALAENNAALSGGTDVPSAPAPMFETPSAV